MHHKNKLAAILTAALLWISGAVQADEVTIKHNGLTLVGELQVPEGKTLASGPLVLMTHGTLAHGRMEIMEALQNGLLDRGIASLAINLSLGLDSRRGMYECEVPHTHRHTDAMGEIGAWLAWAKAQGAKEVVLLGHSRGGNQTAWFAAENDDAAVKKVVLVAPATWSSEGMHEGYRKAYGKELKPVYERAKKLVDNRRGQEILDEVDFLHCPGTKVSAASFANYYGNEPRMDTPGLLNKINEPVLVIAGSEDTVVAGLIPKTQPLADSGKVELVVIDGADHFFRDLYADEVVEAVVSFIGDN